METENEQVNDDAGFLARLKQVFTSSQPEAPEELNPFKQVPPAQASQQAAQGAQGAQSAQNVQSTQGASSSDVFKQYVAKQNFLDGVEYDAAELMQDPSKLGNFINSVAQRAYGKALYDATSVIDKAIENRLNAYDSNVSNKIQAAVSSRSQLDKATREIPLMKDPSAAPIITQVMKGFLQQGKSLDEATEATKTFLQDFSNKLSSKSADEKAADKHRKDLDGLFGNLLINK
jgi:hypothetical protein|nr:MAG TPA: hypothetical protein [Caudoviricetes sp.]